MEHDPLGARPADARGQTEPGRDRSAGGNGAGSADDVEIGTLVDPWELLLWCVARNGSFSLCDLLRHTTLMERMRLRALSVQRLRLGAAPGPARTLPANEPPPH